MTQVAAAILRREGRILICQRGEGGSCAFLWEFPGGKVEVGETAADCVVRECREELSIAIRAGEVFATTTYRYPEREVGFTFFNAEYISGEIKQNVHMDHRWVTPKELTEFPFCPADREIVRRLAEGEGSSPV